MSTTRSVGTTRSGREPRDAADAAGRGRRAAPEPASRIAPTLGAGVQDHLGAQLRALYDAFTCAPCPPHLGRLVARLERTGTQADDAAAFRDGLLASLPALRAFALGLAPPGQADDLVQETLLKAWQSQNRFTPGTNLKAWLFTILRNSFYSQHRRQRREVEDVDGLAAAGMVALPSQEHTATLATVAAHLRRLPPSQREALVLVGAQGMTYEAAAAVLGCQVGTVKSRVSRSRAALVGTLGLIDA